MRTSHWGLALCTLALACGGSSTNNDTCTVTAAEVAGTWTASGNDLIGHLYSSTGASLGSAAATQTLTVTATGACTVSLAVEYTSSKYTGPCTGTISGSTITSSCTSQSLATASTPNCVSSAAFQRVDIVDTTATPFKLATTYAYSLANASTGTCSIAGDKVTAAGTLTKSP